MPLKNVPNADNGLQHPANSVSSLVWGYEWAQYNADKRLSDDSQRLFHNKDHLEFWYGPDPDAPGSWNGPDIQVLKGPDLSLPIPQKKDIFFIIRQTGGSWDRLRITHSTFFNLLARNNAFPYFMRTVHAFGFRMNENNDTWDNFHWRLSGATDIVEVCYTVRFYEKNAQGGATPWSLRQVGLYQQIETSTQQAKWIILQFSGTIQNAMVEKLKKISQDTDLFTQRHILLHLAALLSSLRNWDQYLDYQAEQLEKLEDKAYFLKLDNKDPFDYTLSFTDRQNLQLLRCELMKASSVLNSALRLGNAIRALYKDTGALETPVVDLIVLEFDDYIEQTKYYQHCVSSLLSRSGEVATLLSNMLEYRTGKSTLRIAEQGEIESGISQKDSLNIKALTTVATLYLPASLLAGIFSSNLVQAHSQADAGLSTHFVVAPDFWKFIVLMIPMVLVTFSIVTIFQWLSKRSHKRELAKRSQERDAESVIQGSGAQDPEG